MKPTRAMLTARDTEILVDVYKHRYLSVSQIQRLHFPSLQTTYRRLRVLIELKCVEGFLAPHIPERIFYLASPGAEIVASALGVEAADLKWKENSRAPKDYYFLRHFLQVNDFRILLTKSCPKQGVELVGFIPEYFGKKTDAGGLVKYIRDVVCDINGQNEGVSHTPDAVFALRKEAQPALFLLEIDRGTEIVSNPEKGVLKAVKFYVNYLLQGNFQRYSQDFGCSQFKGFRALIVTTADARAQNIRQAATDLAVSEKAKKFIWLTTYGRLDAHGVFAPIWQSADAHDETLYRIG
jgi:hypothetical protein